MRRSTITTATGLPCNRRAPTCQHDVSVVFLAPQQEVFWLEVAVGNVFGMQVRQHLQERDNQVPGFGLRVGGFVANTVKQLPACHLCAGKKKKKKKKNKKKKKKKRTILIKGAE